MAEKKTKEKDTTIIFTKAQLLQSKRYAHRVDLLGALLEDREYTLEEVDALLNQFMKGKGK